MSLTTGDINDILIELGTTGNLRTYDSHSYDKTTREATLGDATLTAIKLIAPYAMGRHMNFFTNPDAIKKAQALSIISAHNMSVEPMLGTEVIDELNEIWVVVAWHPLKWQSTVVAYQVALVKKEGLRSGDYGYGVYGDGYYWES